MPRAGAPVAFFDMNAITGVPLNRVHNMLTDVERRIGVTRAGRIEVAVPHDNGRYFITFYGRDAADLFERLHRETGKTPIRLTRLPDDVLIIDASDLIVGVIEVSLGDFIRRMRSNLN